MKWLILAGLIAVLPAAAADKPNGRMQACTQAWQDAGRTGPYKLFLKQCLTQPAPAVTAEAVKVKRAEKKPKGPNRMKVCGAQWRKMKADGKTQGQTWRDFSRHCLKT